MHMHAAEEEGTEVDKVRWVWEGASVLQWDVKQPGPANKGLERPKHMTLKRGTLL